MKFTSLILFAAILAIIAIVWLFRALRKQKPAPPVRFARHRGFQRHWRKVAYLPTGLKRLASMLPGHPARVQFANIAEGTSDTGRKSYLADAALTTRYSLVIVGSDANHVAIGAANTEIPLGIAQDESAAAGDLVNVCVFGAANGTQRGVAGGTITVGDLLQSNGDGTIITLKATTGTFYIIGRALVSAVATDTFEFTPCFPTQRVVA